MGQCSQFWSQYSAFLNNLAKKKVVAGIDDPNKIIEIKAIDPNECPVDGISLTSLKEFIKNQGEDKDKSKGVYISRIHNKTTANIVFDIIKPETENKQSSYCEYLKSKVVIDTGKKNSPIGKANVFISHSWDFNFLEVCHTLFNHFNIHKLQSKETKKELKDHEIYVWFDIFSMNQHSEIKLKKFYMTTLKKVIEKIGHTIVIMAPLEHPFTPLTRCWCLYELYCSISYKVKFEVLINDHEKQTFLDEGPVLSALGQLITNLEFHNSETLNQDNKKAILEIFKKEIGLQKINKVLIELLQNRWIVKMYENEMKDEKDLIRIILLKNNLGLLYKMQLKYDKAELLYIDCLKSREKQLGKDHPDTLSSINNLANLYYIQKKYDNAEPLYIAYLQICEEKIGRDHPDIIPAINNLAMLYKTQGKYEQVEPLYQECLEISELKFGRHHLDTLIVIENLADILYLQNKYSEAEPLMVECFKNREKQLGKDHPDTLVSIQNMSNVHFKLKQFNNLSHYYWNVVREEEIQKFQNTDIMLIK